MSNIIIIKYGPAKEPIYELIQQAVKEHHQTSTNVMRKWRAKRASLEATQKKDIWQHPKVIGQALDPLTFYSEPFPFPSFPTASVTKVIGLSSITSSMIPNSFASCGVMK